MSQETKESLQYEYNGVVYRFSSETRLDFFKSAVLNQYNQFVQQLRILTRQANIVVDANVSNIYFYYTIELNSFDIVYNGKRYTSYYDVPNIKVTL